MSHEVKMGLLIIFWVAYLVLLGCVITAGIVVNSEREDVCIAFGYEDYDRSYRACVRGDDLVEMKKYRLVLEGQ